MRRFLFLIAPFALLVVGCQEQRYYEPEDVVQENYVHKYGVDVPQEDWNSRGQSGKVVSTLKNGVVVEKTYDNGVLEGQCTYTFPHSSQIETYETYERGNCVRQLTNYSSGAPKQQTIFGVRGTKQVTTWFDGGNPQAVEEYKKDVVVNGQYFNRQNQLESQVDNGDGIRTMRDRYGQLNASDTMQGGVTVSRTVFHPNGLPSEILPFNDGVVEGVRRTFNPDGSPATVETWSDGVQHGQTVEFHNGEKSAEVTYYNGAKHGTEVRYRDGSERISESQYVNGQKHGQSNTYVGDNAKTEWYFQDRLVSKKEFDILTHDRAYAQ